MPAETFVADDALGWVYQFWQKDKKDEVNASERKIGGADLGPVTQLFTENYMVRFLLENSLGAWWAARHPDSPLVKGFEYLRFDDDGKPAAGSFDGWPDRVAEVTVMDPCCGSGHFLVEAFSMLWQMRAEEEGLAPVDAQDAVLRDNLFGLELDPRCVQIAMFAVALQAWKAGGGWRQLPVPNIACSGIPVKAPVEEWKALAGGDERLENALVRLHILFRDADTLGSLIDPQTSDGSHRSDRPADVARRCRLGRGRAALERARSSRSAGSGDRGARRGRAAALRELRLLLDGYTLVATNVPYLGRGEAVDELAATSSTRYHRGRADDLATAFARRARRAASHAGGRRHVSLPQNWLFLSVVRSVSRELLLQTHDCRMCRAARRRRVRSDQRARSSSRRSYDCYDNALADVSDDRRHRRSATCPTRRSRSARTPRSHAQSPSTSASSCANPDCSDHSPSLATSTRSARTMRPRSQGMMTGDDAAVQSQLLGSCMTWASDWEYFQSAASQRQPVSADVDT